MKLGCSDPAGGGGTWLVKKWVGMLCTVKRMYKTGLTWMDRKGMEMEWHGDEE